MDSINSSASSAQSAVQTHEVRECRSCYGAGEVTTDVEVAFEWYEARIDVCPICHGSGEVSVFLYEHARRA